MSYQRYDPGCSLPPTFPRRTLNAAIQRNRQREQAKRDAIAQRDATIAAYLAEPCSRCGAAPCACPALDMVEGIARTEAPRCAACGEGQGRLYGDGPYYCGICYEAVSA
jgi:hypothetical protein